MNHQPIPLSAPCLQGNEWNYIKECLDTNWVSSVGSYVTRFEKETASYVGVEHAVAMVNGTAAIHIALLVAGVQPDDEVIVPALTFISPANCVRYVGAYPVFIDVEPDYWQIDVAKVADFIKTQCVWKNSELRNKFTDRRVSAILPVDLLGHPVDMEPLAEIAKKYDLKIIEDATESLGAKYKDNHVGQIADIACFSFNGNKIITTGGGGMLVTNNAEYAEKARYLSQQAKDDSLEYIHNEIGYNYRLTNIQAAMGCAQLEQLDAYVRKKQQIAERYTIALKGILGIRCPEQAEWANSTFWLYTILVNRDKYGMDSRGLLKKLQSWNIQTRPLWHPICKLPPFRDCESFKIEVAERLCSTALSLPCSVDISPEEQERVIKAIRD